MKKSKKAKKKQKTLHKRGVFYKIAKKTETENFVFYVVTIKLIKNQTH